MKYKDCQRSTAATQLYVAALMSFALACAATSATVQAAGVTVTPSLVLVNKSTGAVTLRVTVQKPPQAGALKVVAAEVTGSDVRTTFPTLYDDGTHGDTTAGDGVYSLQAALPVASGEFAVTYYVVDADGFESVVGPSTFSLD